MIPASQYFKNTSKDVDGMFVERNLLLLLSHMLGRGLDDVTRRQAVESWITALPPAQAQIAAEMLWKIFPHDEENLSKWQQSER